MLEVIRRVIGIRESKKKRQYNDRKKNDLENTTQETKDPPWITLENGGEVMWFGKVSSFCSTSDTRRVIVKRHNNNSSDIQGEQMLGQY